MNLSTTLRVFAFAAVVTAAILPAIPAWAVDPLWEPRPVPAQCSTANVHLLLQDISGSMRRLLPAALGQQATYVEHVNDSDCLYLVYAEFGATASVVTDGFLVSDGERARVAAEIRSRPRTQAKTNFDEAGALVELTLLKVERAYAEVPWAFTTSVISDHIPDPGEGHQPFDLQTYLSRRQLSGHVGVLRVKLVRRGDVPSADQVRSTLGRVSAPVGSLSKVLRAAVVPVEPPAPAVSATPPAPVEVSTAAQELTVAFPASTPAGTPANGLGETHPEAGRAGMRFPAWVWAGGGAIALLVILFVVASARRAGPPLLESADDRTGLLDVRIPRALRITEQKMDETGTVKDVIRQRLDVPVAVGVPVVFAVDLTADVPLRPVPGVPNGNVFTVTVEADGQILVRGVKGFLCNGKSLPRMGTLVDATTTVQFDLGMRRWLIAAVWENAGRIDGLLAPPLRTQTAAGPAPEPRHAEVE